jgi:hypothetical protein
MIKSRRLAIWEAAVARRRAGIMRALAKLRRARGVQRRARLEANLLNMEHYGIMNRHRQHWHKINGQWYKNIISARIKRR